MDSLDLPMDLLWGSDQSSLSDFSNAREEEIFIFPDSFVNGMLNVQFLQITFIKQSYLLENFSIYSLIEVELCDNLKPVEEVEIPLSMEEFDQMLLLQSTFNATANIDMNTG